ncbi:AAA family ATPase [Blautia sp. HCP3S3_C12]|uniref:AAA family ATPase n=1 Tax=unclassified Blautia TaxID=2648079 RepID=UPI003F894308
MSYTQEQIDRANQVNLEKFLCSQGEELIQSGREYRWKNHDSLTVKGNKWFRHSQSKGGYPIDFVMEFYNKTFPEAMQMLIGVNEVEIVAEPKQKTEFRLPPRCESNDRIIKYLTEERKLPKELVEEFIASGLIYEDAKHHNVVFIGKDTNGIPRYAHCRGTSDKFRMDVAGSDKSYGFCYRGKGTELYVFEASIDMLSHIALYPAGWRERSYLSLGGVSSKALERFFSERKNIESIYIATDNDEAGNNAAEKLAELIPQEISVYRFLPQAKDWNEDLINERNGLPTDDYVTIGVRKPKEIPKSVPMICMNDVEQTEVDWLWYPYIPFGKLTIVQGNPGEGKTFFAMQLAAACTNQKFLPDMEPFEPFNMIFQTAEDGLGDTVKPRLVSSGADLQRVLVIDDSDNPLTLADDRIEKAIRENNARLMVIDPLQAFLGANVDMNRANEVRPVFRKLADIAQSTGCAIVMIGHLNKASGTQSTYRGLGSIDIAAVVRSILFVGKVKDDPTTRVIVHEKSSLTPPGQALAFSLGDQKGFRWIGAYDISAEDLLAGGEGTRTELKQEQAMKLIYEFLSDGREASVAEINKEAIERGISERTVRMVRNSMKEKLESERRGKDWWIWLKRQNEAANSL